MSDWAVGQRCASKGEPALGLGTVKEVGRRNIRVVFVATHTERVYALEKAPLKRVTFEPGDVVRDNTGKGFVVREVKDKNGMLFYCGESGMLPETELNHTIVFSRPHQKLLSGQVDKPKDFDLRLLSWKLKSRSLASPCRGFVGARIELLPHQLYIAGEVAGRHQPRVLLSDEVGLGKTIEAGLIFHHLWMIGEAKRVLCLVPGALLHQWLREFYRKFNVLFNIMTANNAEELEKIHPEGNPYHAHQCVLQELGEASRHEGLSKWLVEAEWDLVIVDEAHHLLWTAKGGSSEYRLVEALSCVCGGLLLLTATPRQLGLESHFSRLKLLDPDRFDDFDTFKEESERYAILADIADRVLSGRIVGVRQDIKRLYPKDPDLAALAPVKGKPADPARDEAFLRALIDRHGTGRMVYRNRRKVLPGFPKRNIVPVPLENPKDYRRFLQVSMAAMADNLDGQRVLAGPAAFRGREFGEKAVAVRQILKKAWQNDPRLGWLLTCLRENAGEKFLLICSRKSVVLALQEWLGLAKDIEVAVFHEDLSIIERDRQAAYFAKPEGARILLCSEIGSEGRNFQFAHKLILFDLPLNPALLEQRIGRLDRIGQHHDIDIYIPYPQESPLQHLYHWYQRGLDAFENHLIEGDYIYEHIKEKIFTVFHAVEKPDLMKGFIEESRQFCEELRQTIRKGRDRLLELNSFNPEKAAQLIADIRAEQENTTLKRFMDDLFEVCGVLVEDQESLKTQIVKPSTHMFVESFPHLPEDGLEITYDRQTAVTREELAFLTLDHPMVIGAIDMWQGIGKGGTSFAIWKQAPEAGILLQCLFILESPSGDILQLARYLPPVPLTITVDQNQRRRMDLEDLLVSAKLEHGPVAKIYKQRDALTEIVESLIIVAEREVEVDVGDLMVKAEERAKNAHKEEYDRLKALIGINPCVHEDELAHVEERLGIILDHLEISRFRLDGLRLIMMVP